MYYLYTLCVCICALGIKRIHCPSPGAHFHPLGAVLVSLNREEFEVGGH